MAKKKKVPAMEFVRRAQAHANDIARIVAEHCSEVLRNMERDELEEYVKCVDHGMLFNLEAFFKKKGMSAMAAETRKAINQMKWEDGDDD